jgi:hypothetical protein
VALRDAEQFTRATADLRVAAASAFLAPVLQVDASLRSSTIAARRQRIVSGENGGVNGMPFALRSGSPLRRTRSGPAWVSL